ncbi:MAG TPA: ester cyclase [Methyloceanibacter sp.]|nr:ester cyclase [Methyloceanibacter sp.]
MSSDPTGGHGAGDLGAMFDAHCEAEFVGRDIDATMATMNAAPHITNMPTMTGGFGFGAVRHFYDNYFVGHVPDDWTVMPISRTVGESQLVDEVMISFTHDSDMPAILPGVKPTGSKVTIPFVVVVGFEDGKVAFERNYWDQASILAQIGLLDKTNLPVSGAEQAARLRDPSLPSNTLITKV